MKKMNRWTGIKKTSRLTERQGRSIGHGVEACPDCKSMNTRIHWQGDFHCKNCGLELSAEQLNTIKGE